jgi:NTE family protein
MKKQLAFALGGGGARGALQVGALRALLEAGYQPDLLVGTSAGAINATFLALRGVSLQVIDELEQAWYDAAEADLLPPNYLWLTVRSLFRRAGADRAHVLQDFLTAHGVDAHTRFGDLQGTRLILVAADLKSGSSALYGLHPDEPVLEGLLASTALPPWVAPIEKGEQLLMDGGVVSNVPIEPAMIAGASEVIALDLTDLSSLEHEANGFGTFLARLLATVDRRQLEMEMSLAEARGVQVRHIHLHSDQPAPLWDFSRTQELIWRGYAQTRGELLRWQAESQPGLRGWLRRLLRRQG